MDTDPTFLPSWNGDETLYSWAARFHILSGSCSARETGLRLFRAAHACREPTAPSTIAEFVNYTKGRLGNAESLLVNRTAIGAYYPFLTHAQRLAFSASIHAQQVTAWRTKFTMPASGLGGLQTLRYCPNCIANDLGTWGLARWRLFHQLPGCWVCLDHSQPLFSVQATRAMLYLPPTGFKEDGVVLKRWETCREDCRSSLLALAHLGKQLIGSLPLDIAPIKQAVVDSLREQGVTSWGYPLSRDRLANWFASKPLSLWLNTLGEPEQRLADGLWIHDLLRHRRASHPIKWMVLWCSLFDGLATDVCVAKLFDPNTTISWDVSGQGSLWSVEDSAQGIEWLQVIQTAPSLPAAATALGISLTSLRRRAARLHLSLSGPRTRLTLAYRREAAIRALETYMTTYPTCSKSDLHNECKAAVSWLRGHDRETLNMILARIQDLRGQQFSLKW